MTHNLSTKLTSYLAKWHGTSTTAKAANPDITVTLTLSEFIDLFTSKQIASLEKAIEGDYLKLMQKAANKYALVLTWRSYKARSTNTFSASTAFICSRERSLTINKPAKGDKLRKSHRDNIVKGTTGLAKTQTHKESISESLAGKPKQAWTAERKAARSLQRKAQEAARRGDQL